MKARPHLLWLATGPLLTLASVGAWAQSPPADIPEMTLKVAESFPPVGFVPDVTKKWAETIIQKTGGKVKLQFFWSDSLFKQADGATNLPAGVADFARVPSTYDPAKTLLWMTLDMPMNARDYWCGISSAVKVQRDEPNLKKKFEELGFMPIVGYSSGHFQFLARTPIEKLADLKGKRLRSYGGARVKMYELLGLAPIFMPYGQIYEAVERGVVDGAEATILLTESFKHYEVAKFMTLGGTGFVVAAPLSIGLRRWNTFPESLKKIFIEAGHEHDMAFAKGMIELESVRLKEFQDNRGMKVIKLSAEEDAALKKAGLDAQELWLKDMDARNVPARATWKVFQDLQTDCEKQVAAKGYPWAPK